MTKPKINICLTFSSLLIICMLFISCTGAKSTDKQTNANAKAKLTEYRSEDFPARFTDIVIRKPDIELTVSIEIEAESRSGLAFQKTLEKTREITLTQCKSLFPASTSPPVNILIEVDGQITDIVAGGEGHDAAIALNLPTDIPAFVNFSAGWCEKGHATDDAMSEVSDAVGSKIHFMTVDTDDEIGLTEVLHITEIPTQMVFDKKGKLVGTYPGPMEKEQITEILLPLIDK